jgi:hypothetical protein
MSNFTAIRPGQSLGAGDVNALFLKLYAGEVLTTFSKQTVMMPITSVQTITTGHSFQFPITGVVTGGYHQAGVEIVGQAALHRERLIMVDDKLLASIFIDNLEEAKNHWPVRKIYSNEAGVFLATSLDNRLLRVAILAARAAENIAGVTGTGTVITSVNSATQVAALKQALLDAAQKLDEKNVVRNDRHAVLKPAQWYLLLQDTQVISKDFDVGGSLRKAKVGEFADFTLHMSNNLPTGVVAAITPGENNPYDGTFTTTVFTAFQKGAIATVKLWGLRTEMEYSTRHQGTLIVAKYVMGHGILRPEAAVEVKTA